VGIAHETHAHSRFYLKNDLNKNGLNLEEISLKRGFRDTMSWSVWSLVIVLPPPLYEQCHRRQQSRWTEARIQPFTCRLLCRHPKLEAEIRWCYCCETVQPVSFQFISFDEMSPWPVSMSKAFFQKTWN